ncbi:serine protease [Sphingomonas canadensis]|uniref:Serine protease n=1 Tax=Sphingomonas canadensis TaxID=1219257 RepID=A0ABW3HD04_9SPHN|nr:serine protease [Sphingomonas canadensis]MCW3837236.1 serine protease [Sphingomonas canadensis]
MPFPSKKEYPDERGLFVVQDPQVRARILPLFSFDPQAPAERPVGHGTAFRIDPWGTCATAFHVVEDLLTVAGGQAVLRDDIRLAALEFEGIGYGTFALPKDSWRPFSGMFSLSRVDVPLVGTPRVRNVTELAALSIERSGSANGPTPYLPIDMRQWQPKVGERVMALGFADLDVDAHGEGDARAMSQYLYGSEAAICEIQKPDLQTNRPWPVFRVEADWPGGMSGGPVFNEEGNVIGLVSTGLVGGGIGTATSFAGWNVAEGTFRTLDPSNPGALLCWTAFDAEDRIVSYAPAKDMLLPLVADGRATEIHATALNPETGNYFLL